MRPRHLAASPLLLGLALTLGAPPASAADDPQGFVEHGHQHLSELLRQPESSARAGELDKALTSFVDYDELTRRAFGQPCPAAEPSCEDLWGGYTDAQRAEVRTLLEKLIRKNYEKNLKKTLDYEVTYRGQRDASGDTKVLTEAKNKLKPREPAVRIDYVVKNTEKGPKVVDIITEGSSMTKVYYDQFRKKMHEPTEGYPNIVLKLHEKIDS